MFSIDSNRFALLALLVAVAAFASGCQSKSSEATKSAKTKTKKTNGGTPTKEPQKELIVTSEPLSEKIAGQDVTQYTLQNKNGVIVELIDFGATVISVKTPDRDGNNGEITLSHKKFETYATNPNYFGCTVGRFCNRIANGKFSIDGKEYQLTVNDGKHTLHGGKAGFCHRLWKGEKLPKTDDTVGVQFTLISPDGDQGFPGQVVAVVTYTLNDNNELKIDYKATVSGKPTHVNLTNHCYWNLAGGGDILKHELKLNCDQFLPVDGTLIPTGDKKDVKGTVWDFTTATAVGKRIEDEALGKKGAKGRGYDHCYVIRENAADAKTNLTTVAEVFDPKSGRVMTVATDQPGIQFYSGNFLDGSSNSAGAPQHGALCLECQQFPDAPNQKKFPSTLVKPGETYTQTTVHRFSVRK